MGSNPQAAPEVSIDSIRVPSFPKPSATLKEFTEIEEEFYKAHTSGLRQDIAERKIYAKRIFVLICCWLVAAFLLLVADGIGFHFALSDSVVLAVIGSTTINVLGIFYIVTHYLFPKR